MPLMIPRDRAGQDSMARAAPAGHSAPMPMPSSARKRNRNQKLGAKPAMKLQSEYHAIEIISGVLRPTRSASQPDPHAPTRRIHSVIVKTAVTSVKETPNSLAIGTMISRNTVKSNASSVQPNQPAHQASHWSLVGSFHQGIALAVPTAVVMARTSFMRVGRGERRHDDANRGGARLHAPSYPSGRLRRIRPTTPCSFAARLGGGPQLGWIAKWPRC